MIRSDQISAEGPVSDLSKNSFKGAVDGAHVGHRSRSRVPSFQHMEAGLFLIIQPISNYTERERES